MDEKSLHELLARAVATEPPAGPMARNALRIGIRLRRRRRIQGATACAAVVAVIAVAIPAWSGAGRGGHVPSAAPNTPGKPIRAGDGPRNLVIVP
jgi:hypothetical protein